MLESRNRKAESGEWVVWRRAQQSGKPTQTGGPRPTQRCRTVASAEDVPSGVLLIVGDELSVFRSVEGVRRRKRRI